MRARNIQNRLVQNRLPIELYSKRHSWAVKWNLFRVFLLAFTVFLSFSTHSFAQVGGRYQIGLSLGNDCEGNAVDTISGSPNFITASQYTTNNGTLQIMVSELEPDGNVVWSRVYGDLDYITHAWDVKAAPAGAFVVVGETINTISGDFEAFILQLDPNGAIQWYTYHGQPQREEGLYAVVDYDGFAYVATGSRDILNPNTGISRDMNVLTVSNNTGSLFSEGTFGGDLNDEGYDVINIGGGYFIAVGYSQSFSTSGDPDVYVVKFDSLSNQIWGKVYGGTGDDVAYGIVQVSPNKFAISGETSSFGSTGDPQTFLLEIDSLGNILNQEVYENSNYGGSGRDIKTTSNGGYIISGGTTITPEAFLLKLDSNRAVEWYRQYQGEIIRQFEKRDADYIGVGRVLNNVTNNDEFYCIRTGPDGIVGSMCGDLNFNLVQVAPNFVTNTGTVSQSGPASGQWINMPDSTVNLVTDVKCASVGVKEPDLPAFSLYPNPAVDQVLVRLEHAALEGFSYELMDVRGQRILGGVSDQDEVRLDLSELAGGMYFLRVRVGEMVQTEKLVKW